MIVGWRRSREGLPGPLKIQREFKAMACYQGMKFPHCFVTSDMVPLDGEVSQHRIFFILSSSGKINTAGLRSEGDVEKVQNFERAMFQRLVPRVGRDTERSPFLQQQQHRAPRGPYAEFCDHDRRRLMEAFDFPATREVKQFNVSDLTVATQKRKDKLRGPTLLNAGTYPSLSFYLRDVQNYINMYGSDNVQSLHAYYGIRGPFPPGELLDPATD